MTTFVLLAFIMWAELRGETSVAVWRRRLPQDVQRQALTIALSGVGVVMGGTWLLLSISHLPLQEVLFEVVSASATVGLTTGITPCLPDAGKLLLVALMFFGRLGPIALGAALALRSRPRRYEFPDERPIVG